ncbi:hypothetical protein [uncultured Gammaproteobacteria bacterium]|jgi:hypothetical protein|nr:hypothetical protein [uncultured Gammaproteobacteria bacterium]CAC9558664.1 hypothetical protein [uncultured Gammaproteobacteria bacterium]CAC9968625.1 hypothetical protein [uncultured Gammaproteobacteria bacterium]CAC9969523.1 hypothetical protein [uncultured Gammaproteobacteria bacterium]
MSKIIQITLVVFFLYGCTTTSTTTPTTKVTTAKATTAKATTKLTTTPKTQKKYSDNEGLFFQIEKYKSIEDYRNACLVLNKIENKYKKLLKEEMSDPRYDLAKKDYERFGCDSRNLIEIPGKWENRVIKLQSDKAENNRFVVFDGQVFSSNMQEYIDKNHSIFMHVFIPPLDLFNNKQLKSKMFFTYHNYITDKSLQYNSYQALKNSELKIALDENKKPMERKGIYRGNSYYEVEVKGKDAFYMKFLSLECKENRADCLVKYQVYNYRAKNFKELRDAYKKNIGNYKFKGFSK